MEGGAVQMECVMAHKMPSAPTFDSSELAQGFGSSSASDTDGGGFHSSTSQPNLSLFCH